MRGAPLVVTVLGLLGAGCGGGSATARGTPPAAATPPAVVGSITTRSTTASVSFGSPVPATPTARVAATARPSSSAAAAARTAAPAAPPGPCTPGDVGITTTTDHPSYPSGTTVTVTVVVRNLSAGGCLFSAPGDFTIEPDPSGAAVYAVHLACAAAGCVPLEPGQMTTYPVPWTNQVANQGSAPNQQAPAGSYHARAAFSGYPASTSAPFTIGP